MIKLQDNYFIASFDNRYATNKKSKNSEYVGNKYETKVFKTVDKFLEHSQLLQFNSCSFGSYFNNDQEWANTEDNKSGTIRNLKINSQGFQLVFIDCDNESYNGIYSPEYIETNLDIIKDSNCAMVLKSSSYGKPDPEYPNGVKRGKRLLWILDKPIEALNVSHYFTDEEWTNITTNTRTNPSYNLISNGKVNEEMTYFYHENTTILSLIYKYFVCYLGNKIGISDTDPETIGFDPASLKIAQKMMGSGNGCLLQQDVRIKSTDILPLAVEWIKERYNYVRKTPKGIKLVHSDGTTTDFNPIEFNADVASILSSYIPIRVKGSGSYSNYLIIATALKYLNVDKSNIISMFDDRNEGENVYNNVKPIFKDAIQALGVLENTVVHKMGIQLMPSKEHKSTTYTQIIKVNEQYLAPSIVENQIKNGNTTINFQSLHGTGKTMMLKGALPYFKENDWKVIYVSHLRSILRTTATKLGLAYYEDSLESDVGLCITPDSFHRLDGMDFSKCILVIDEHTQVIRKMAGDYMKIKDRNYYKSLQNFWKAIETAHITISMDADDYIGVPELMNKKPVKIQNDYQTDRMNLTFFRWAQDEHFEDRIKASKKEYCSRTTHSFETILSLLKEGKKVAIPCSKKSTAKKLHTFLIKNGMNGFCLMSETENKPEAFDQIAFNKVPYQYCIYTYTAWTGFDVSVGSHSIDLVVAIFEGVAGLNHDDMAQAMRRFRGVSEGIVYGQWTASVKLLPFDVFIEERNKKEKAIMTSSLCKSFEDVHMLKMPTKFHDILLYVNFVDRVYANYVSFDKFCKKIGDGKIFYESNEWRPEKEIQKCMGAIHKETKDNAIKDYIDAEYLSDQEYNQLWKSDKTHKQDIAIQKTYLARAIGKPSLDFLLANAEIYEITPRKLKSIPQMLSNYLMKDPKYKFDLLMYKSKFLPEWDKDTDKLAINLLMGDVSKVDIEKQMELSDLIHGMMEQHVNNSINDEILSSMGKSCNKWRKDNKQVHASISMGDTISDEKYMGINVNALEYESLGDAKFYKTWKASINHLINGVAGSVGYYIDKQKKQVNKERKIVNSVRVDPIITALIDTGAVDYINGKFKPITEVEVNW